MALNLTKRQFIRAVKFTAFYLINAALVLLLILPAVSASIEWWWLENLLNLQLQWSIIAIIFVCLNLLFIKTYRWSIALLYLSLMIYNLTPLYLKQQSNQINVADHNNIINIAQLNLRYDNPYLVKLLPTLGDPTFDLLIVQEASDAKHQTIKQLGQYYPYSFGISSQEATPDGMAIFSRWPIIEQHNHALGEQQGHLLEVLLQKNGLISPIQLFALHPVSPRTEQLWKIRNNALTLSAHMIAASPFANKIVVGDFNSSPWSTEFKNFKLISKLKSSADGFGYIPSWSYSDIPILSLLSSAYIDHQLVSQSFHVVAKNAWPIEGSDHQMILTKLQIAK